MWQGTGIATFTAVDVSDLVYDVCARCDSCHYMYAYHSGVDIMYGLVPHEDLEGLLAIRDPVRRIRLLERNVENKEA